MSHRITISRSADGNGYTYSPNPLRDVRQGDEVFWYNADTVPHWPGTSEQAPGNAYFMPNQIAENSTSTIWTSDASVTYFDSLDQSTNRPTGTIEVTPV